MMDGCRLKARFAVLVTAVLLTSLAPPTVPVAFGGGGIGGGGNTVSGNFQNAGVVVDAQGVLRIKRVADPGGLQAKRIAEAALAALNPKLAKVSELRKISLNRLEKTVASQLTAGQPVSDEMKYLAGLLRIQYVFFYPETGDIVLAGPAEGFAEDPVGRVRGLTSGRPVLQLQDLITAMRAYPPTGSGQGSKLNVIGVSIDPTPEGLERLRQTLASVGGRLRPGDDVRLAATLRDALGLQTVSVQGISPKSHFAQVLVEADYRMKLIGIGLEQPPVKIPSFVSRADAAGVARNALQRWYFVPDYKCVRVSEDGLGMQLEGWGVKLVGQSELVQEGGVRQQAGGESKASKAFCTAFTEQYPKLADVEPVYAELRNLIDMSVAAAFIQEKDYYQQANWNLGVFADEAQFPIDTFETPKQVESAVNVVWKGNTLMTPIGGGVHVEPLQALTTENVLQDTEGKVSAGHGKITLKDLPEGQWWWD
ncbi:MAG: DUF1598 domain-containing protein [Pirellulaceae bacterium]